MPRGSGRARKHTRLDDGGTYHDLIPFGDKYDTIFFRESHSTVPTSRVAQPSTDSWDSISSWATYDDLQYALDPDSELYARTVEANVTEDVSEGIMPKKKRQRSKVSRRPHVVWMDLHRQSYLDEMCRWAGQGDYQHITECLDCIARGLASGAWGQAEYRCRECIQPDLTCSSCCVKRHRLHPLHHIEKWSGEQFVKVSLKSLGLKLQLNHTSACPNPVAFHTEMLVLHTNGIHEVAIQYCGCTHAIPQHLQLLHHHLYPASQILVKTCASFNLLEMLHKFALTTKSSTYNFYSALERLTVNTGVDVPKSCYRPLLCMTLQWRHLKMLKRGGRGHAESGVLGTQQGELAIPCPSCPRPEVNLPANWHKSLPDVRFLYTVFMCMDANFRLKNNLVSNYSQDPGLGNGWSYMVPRLPYERYVLSRAKDEDISTCVGFQALAKADTKFSAGLRYTGVNLTCCGRSEMVFPLGVGNLQKGERYANMDYIFGSALQTVLVASVLISYDIACQWFVNLSTRMESHWPEEIKPHEGIHLTPAIPKLHEPMHRTASHQKYSLNFIKGVGHSDCESPERIWSLLNALAKFTKPMGPGSRGDAIEDQIAFYNWNKYIGQGDTLLRRIKSAVAEKNIQAEAHRGLTEALEEALVEKWKAMVVAWEEDGFPKTKKNPYETDGVTISEAQVRKQLAEEEERRLAGGGVAVHETSASGFLLMALDLEDMQQRLQRLAKSTMDSATTRQEGSLTEQRNIFRTRQKALEKLTPVYMPGLLQYRADLAAASSQSTVSSSNPEDSVIWTPSQIPGQQRAWVCLPALAEMEDQLRTARCRDALDAIRQTLRMKTRMIAFKNKNMRGQRQGTRSRAVIDRVHEKAKISADKYRAAHQAKLALVGPGDWEKELKVLDNTNICGYQDPNHLKSRQPRQGILKDDQLEAQHMWVDESNTEAEVLLFNETRSRRDGTGETRRTLSWIWLGAGAGSPDDANNDILHAEWAKSRARSARAAEEVLLLQEEMHRVLVFLGWRSKWWKDRASRRDGVDHTLAEGLRSYALTQSGVQDALTKHFNVLWQKKPANDKTTLPAMATATATATAMATATATATAAPHRGPIADYIDSEDEGSEDDSEDGRGDRQEYDDSDDDD